MLASQNGPQTLWECAALDKRYLRGQETRPHETPALAKKHLKVVEVVPGGAHQNAAEGADMRKPPLLSA